VCVPTLGAGAEPNREIREFGTTTAALEVSFVPEAEIRQLRDLRRTRTTLVQECVQAGNRLRKVLEDANIKLDGVASNALGVSGRATGLYRIGRQQKLGHGDVTSGFPLFPNATPPPSAAFSRSRR
jgi:hypothetical protein